MLFINDTIWSSVPEAVVASVPVPVVCSSKEMVSDLIEVSRSIIEPTASYICSTREPAVAAALA